MPIDSNNHVRLLERAEFEWTSIEANSELFSILEDGTMASRLPLLARVYELKSWFRQLEIDRTEWWMNICHVGGGGSGRM